MATATKSKDKAATITINVTVAGGQGTAPDSEAARGDAIAWTIDGDVGPGDEVVVGPFVAHAGGGSPMAKSDDQRKRTGKGTVQDQVRLDARPDGYHYEITVNRASGTATVVDPEIQIKP